MKSSWFQILLIVTLLGLLAVLATLQYQWLGQISDAEQTRLELRLKDDTKRFAEDFDKEIQNTYFLFQLTGEDWGSFSKRYEDWLESTEYPDLILNIYFVKTSDNDELTSFNRKTKEFESKEWTDDLKEIRKTFADENHFEQFSEKHFALVLPVHKSRSELKTFLSGLNKSLLVKDPKGKIITENIIGKNRIESSTEKSFGEFQIPKKEGFLIIRLNENLIKNKIFPSLVNKYFSENEAGSYKVSITSKYGSKIFQTHSEAISESDAQAKLFKLSQQNFWIFRNKDTITKTRNNVRSQVVISNTISATNSKNRINKPKDELNIEDDQNIQVDLVGSKPRFQIFEGNGLHLLGLWTVKVQHIDGSLKQFVTNTRRKNLAISFGILSLLAVSIILIFLSSQRAKRLAQKQMDFVSSVSHEFRTPLAVIYSAGENLSDGVVDKKEKISNYGALIKREGKKLSGMVEQILEFAGARSGKRKYDFREVEIDEIINEALAGCEQFIEENDFEVHKDIAKSLPKVSADEKALTLAVQNLINNSLKYSNGSRWLKVSAKNGDGAVKIAVEDKGIGISSKDKKQIFEPFFRSAKVVDEQISGNGLGLSLVKQVIEDHGGKVEVESEIGKGSTFIIELPLN